jgi:predicted nucleotidyltransferase
MAVRFPRVQERKEKLQVKLKAMLDKIKTRDVEKVILFGSMVTGELGSTSDIDLIIIQKTTKRFLDRLEEWYTFLEPDVAVDILVYTPEEISEMITWNRFIRMALEQGEVLFEAVKR